MKFGAKAAQSAPREDTWPRCWLLSAVTGTLGVYLWPLGQQGSDLAAALSVLCWLLAISNAFRGLRAWDLEAAYTGVRRKGMKPRQDHGQSAWATLRECTAAGLRKAGGIFLGTLNGRELFYNGEGSGLILAGPAQGKTTCFAIQMLLRLRPPDSAIVLDLKLELWSVCARALERMGFNVLCINPWYKSFAEQFRGTLETKDDGFDPCAFLDPCSDSIIDDCALLASLLVPASPKSTENDQFWRNFALEILIGFMLLALSRDGKVTLPGLRRMLMASTEDIGAAIEEMAESEAFSGTLAEYAGRMADSYLNSAEVWSNALSGASKALRIYDKHGPLGKHVSKNGVDFRTVKDRPTVVFIAIPAEKVATHAPWLGLVITLAMEMIARDRRKQRVLALFDEFQNLPPMEQTLRGIALYRGVGIQYVFLVQFVAALKRSFGDSWREFLGVDFVSLFGSTSDLETLRLFSELVGQQTVRSHSLSSQPEQVTHASLGMSMNLGEQGHPLLRASELRTLETGKQLLLIQNLNPILAEKQSYLDVGHLRRAADPNPYYRKSKS